jgi:hypothetical protein
MSAEELRRWLQQNPKGLREPRSFAWQNLEDVDLHGKEMPGCDFTGAIFGIGQNMSQASFERCVFGPPRGGLKRVILTRVDLSKSNLREARLQGVSLIDCSSVEADLTNADLSKSDCTGTDFTNANMFGVDLRSANLFRARFNRTRLTLKKRPILQAESERWKRWCRDHDYGEPDESEQLEQATAIYLELKENFRSIGAYSEASWAYVQERRMRRAQHGIRVVPKCFELDYPHRKVARVGFYLRHTLIWLADAFIDLTTGYGESLLKTLATLLVSLVGIFPLLYYCAGGVNLISGSAGAQTSNSYPHLLLLSLGSALQGYPGLEPATELGRQLQVIQQFFGVMMIGLLGFVLGKKINQS